MRVPPSEGEEPDRSIGEPHLSPDQAVGPVGIDGERAPEQGDRSLRVRPAEEDDVAGGGDAGVELPRGWERAPGWGLGGAGCPALPDRGDVLGGANLEDGQRGVVEPAPDLGLPPAVEAFEGSLEARVVERGEHGG